MVVPGPRRVQGEPARGPLAPHGTVAPRAPSAPLDTTRTALKPASIEEGPGVVGVSSRPLRAGMQDRLTARHQKGTTRHGTGPHGVTWDGTTTSGNDPGRYGRDAGVRLDTEVLIYRDEVILIDHGSQAPRALSKIRRWEGEESYAARCFPSRRCSNMRSSRMRWADSRQRVTSGYVRRTVLWNSKMIS
jgi:hypothetical protein